VSTPSPSTSSPRASSRIDALLYLGAAVSYIVLSTYHLWLLDWVIGPLWCVAWVWGMPALVRLVRGQPVRPRRGS
jgi:hypothetical protein